MIAPGTEVTVDTPDKTLARATPANSLVLHNGVSVARDVEGIRTLVSQLERPHRAPNTTQVVKTQTNQYVATPKGIAANLINLKRPSYPAVATVDDIEQVIVRIAIDEAGIVRQVTPVRGKRAFSDAAALAVREWRFRPFSADSKPVAITASIVFFFGKNGTVNSPVFEEMGK
jgi:outer membrane biosynthesis protein TonB